MNSFIVARLTYSIAVFLLVPHTPWWLVGTLIFVGFFIFTSYWEAVVIALFYDSLFALPSSSVAYVPDSAYLMTIVSIIGVVIAEFVRVRLLDNHVS